MAAAVLALGAAGLSLPSRREMLVSGAAAGLVSISPPATFAAGPALAASWSATDGFVEKSFIAFDEGAYAAMRDDEGRTPLLAQAIKDRLAGTDDQTVLDVGTGPYALLALIAARAGAKKVYAIEASPEAAKRARAAIFAAKDVPPGVIEVIDGFSTEVEYAPIALPRCHRPLSPSPLCVCTATCRASPRVSRRHVPAQVSLAEKVDLILAEIVGSVASEEGLYATIRDAQARNALSAVDAPTRRSYERCDAPGDRAAQARHLKRPYDASSYIPAGCQTLAAPASYALHYALGPPQESAPPAMYILRRGASLKFVVN